MNKINKTVSIIPDALEDYGIRKPKGSIQTKLKTGIVIPVHDMVQILADLFL